MSSTQPQSTSPSTSPHYSHDPLTRLDKAFRPLIDNSPVISRCAIHHDRPSCLCEASTDPSKHLHDESPYNPHRGQVSPRWHFDVEHKDAKGGLSPVMKPLTLGGAAAGGENQDRELFVGGVEGVKNKEEDHFLGEEFSLKGEEGIQGDSDRDVVPEPAEPLYADAQQEDAEPKEKLSEKQESIAQ